MIFAAQVGAAVNLRRVEFPTVSGLKESVETPIEPSGPSPIRVGGLPIVFMAKFSLDTSGARCVRWEPSIAVDAACRVLGRATVRESAGQSGSNCGDCDG